MTKLQQIQVSMMTVALLFSACSGRPQGQSAVGISNYTNCNMPSDQGKGSLIGSWLSLPIPVIIDQDFYLANDGADMSSIRNAINTWNVWGSLKGHGKAFTIINDGTGASAGAVFPNTTDCAQPTITASETAAVGIWKVRTSGPGKNKRDSCGTGGKLVDDSIQGMTDWTILSGHITGASILLNFDAWNQPGTPVLDLESLLLHELGHVLGLLHSCSGTNDRSSAPSCSSPTVNAKYLQAVMFPSLQSNQLRRLLTQNDYDRVNCLNY